MKFKFKKKLYFIAEAGVNHENSLSLAEKIIKQAADGGASAVKFQTYKAELLASKKSPAYWDTSKVKVKSQFKLFKKFDKFNKDHYFKLKKICDFYKVDFLSTPFDNESAHFLNKFVKYFKIASADITNLPLINKILSFKKPIIFSTGASKLHEIKFTYNYIKKINPKIDVAVLHCILSYPTDYKDSNLNKIILFQKLFNKSEIGLSDHSIPDRNMLLLTRAYQLGATIIEKHFTEKSLKGKKNNDHFHSINSDDLKIFFKNLRLLDEIDGKKKDNREILECEKKSRKFARRSLYTFSAMKKGEVFSLKNLIPKRPGIGISPIYYNKIYGKKAAKNLKNDQLLKWSDIQKK